MDTKEYEARAIAGVQAGFTALRSAYDDRLGAVEAENARVRAHAGQLAGEVIELRAQVAALGGRAPAQSEVVQAPGESIRQAIARAAVAAPFLGRARVQIRAGLEPQALVLGAEDHAWWRIATLELAGPAELLSVRVESTASTAGQCTLVLRDMVVRGEVFLKAPGGIALRLDGNSKLVAPPRAVPASPA